jgi:hypothetical protein
LFFFERKSQFKFVTKFSPRHAASSSMHDACVRITALALGRLPFCDWPVAWSHLPPWMLNHGDR